VLEATLIERILVGGRSTLRVVCRLASINEDRCDHIAEREAFWRTARVRLGKLYRLSAYDIDAIEAQLRQRVLPLPAVIQARCGAEEAASAVRH
jgi:hypothetical protein